MGNASSQQLVVPPEHIGQSEPVQKEEIRTEVIPSSPNVEEKLLKQDQNAIEKKKIREKILQEYPRLRDVLKEVGEFPSSVKPYEDNDVTKKTMSYQVMKEMEELYGYFFEYEQNEQREMIADALADCGAAPTFVLYMNLLTADGKDYPMDGLKLECYQVLRTICWNFSDASLTFCEELGRSGMLSVMLNDLKKLQKSFQDNSVKSFIVLSAMSVLYNCSKSSNNAKYYRELNAIDTVMWYAKNTGDIQGMEVLAPISALTLAFIVDEKHNDVITADSTLIKTIMRLLSGALSSSDRKHQGFGTVELLEGITKLANNVDNSKAIMNLGVMKHLVRLFKEGDADEQAAAAKATWVLSFCEENKTKIQANDEILKSLKQAAESNNPKVKSAASGALWVLKIKKTKKTIPSKPEAKLKQKPLKPLKRRRGSATSMFVNMRQAAFKGYEPEEQEEDSDSVTEDELEDLDDIVGTQEEEQTTNKQNHVMISYQWDHQKLMTRLKLRLEDNGYKTWMDIDEMGGSTLQSMAEAVENSAVVLVCFSQKYKDSVNCRTEGEYAYQRKKRIIPLKMEAQYEPDGWLGAVLGAKFYYDFSNLAMFESMVSGLMKELGESGKVNEPWKVVRAIAPIVRAVQKVKRVSDWTNEEVKKWALEKNLTTLQTRNIDGRVLLFLRKLKQTAPEFFYSRMSDQYGLKNIKDLMFFSEALEDLS